MQQASVPFHLCCSSRRSLLFLVTAAPFSDLKVSFSLVLSSNLFLYNKFDAAAHHFNVELVCGSENLFSNHCYHFIPFILDTRLLGDSFAHIVLSSSICKAWICVMCLNYPKN